VTLHECLIAADDLAYAGIATRVIDLYSAEVLDAGGISARHIAAAARRLAGQ